MSATCRMAASPAAWPWVSLIFFRLSRSTSSSESVSVLRRERVTSTRSVSMNFRRLATPVMSSVAAISVSVEKRRAFSRPSARGWQTSWRYSMSKGSNGSGCDRCATATAPTITSRETSGMSSSERAPRNGLTESGGGPVSPWKTRVLRSSTSGASSGALRSSRSSVTRFSSAGAVPSWATGISTALRECAT